MKLLQACLITLLLATPALQNELKILSTPDGNSGPSPCALTCSGVASFTDSGSYEWGTMFGRAYKNTDISGCGFVSLPVVTATLSGPFYTESKRCPAVYVQYIENGSFNVFTVVDTTGGQMKRNKCAVHWTATGYNC